MSELSFAQPERRSFLLPAVFAAAVLSIVIGLIYLYVPHRTADLAVTHVAVLPTHTVFKSDSKVVGQQAPFEDDLYILATVRVDNHLRVPLTLDDITGAITAPDGADTTTSAIQKNDLPNLYAVFPALLPLSSAPLLRESIIQPAGRAEGMVLLHFPIPQSEWDQRKSASITLDFYNQAPSPSPSPNSDRICSCFCICFCICLYLPLITYHLTLPL